MTHTTHDTRHFVCWQTVRAEGLRGLYKGFIPNWIRIGPHTIITFLVYERLRLWSGLRPF